MDTKNLDDFFKDIDFDVAEPKDGHQERFVEILKKEKSSFRTSGGRVRMLWSPLLGAAAAILIIFMVAGSSFGNLTNDGDLAGISPEMKETHEFYTNLIKTELAKVEEANTPQTEAVVNDALAQMEKLDQEYERLKKDLKNSGQDKRVIYAMISNLQQRIDVLTSVMEQIENIKELKNPNNENNII